MAVCDRLEAQLSTTQTESRRLLEAVLEQALNDDQQPARPDMAADQPQPVAVGADGRPSPSNGSDVP